MNIFQLVVIGTGALLASALAYFALREPSGGKKSVQRLQTLRERHSQSTQDKVEAQLRKAVAEAVKAPEVVKTFETAGSPVAWLDAPEFAKFVAEDSARLIAAVKKIGKVE